ncbi:probable DNA double-strand break repair Rad50 ATPase [Macrobrachium nipponense]|uniref:probable DNA double-strand break repair Rad50 ATPase n=1 Tax=Macrobrachium nipponense TaxID=159736 RepID=UPI0030C898C3
MLSLFGSPLLFGSANVVYILGKNLVVFIFGGLLAYLFGQYFAELSSFAHEKELLLKELEEAYLMNLTLLDEIEASSDKEELLAETIEELAKDLADEQYRVDELVNIVDEDQLRLTKAENDNEDIVSRNLLLRKENEKCQDAIIQRNKKVDKLEEQLKLKGTECARNGEVIRELREEIADNELYCDVLEEKVKHHEEEAEKTKYLVSDLKENLKEFQDQVNVLRARNCDLLRSMEREAHENFGLEREVQMLQDGNQRLQRDLALKESQIAASMEALHDERRKNEILAEELLVMKKWIAELAGEKEKMKDTLVEKECHISSAAELMEKQREKNRLQAEELQVLRNWIAELAGEKENLKEKLAEKEMEANAVKKVAELLEITKEKVTELESTLKQVQERIREAEENADKEKLNDEKEVYLRAENEEGDDSDKDNEVESEVNQDSEGYAHEANKVGELERKDVNQEDVELTEDNKEEREEMEQCPQTNNEESNKVDTKNILKKKRRNKKRRKPAGEEDSSRLCVVQSLVLETHNENLHSIMLPAEFQELLQKNENGLDFVKYKNKVMLNFMHHDKAHVRAVLSRCSKSAAEEVLIDLQKLLLRILK